MATVNQPGQPSNRVRTGNTQAARLELDPTTQGQISQAQATLPGLANQLGSAGQNLFTNFSSFNPALNTQFAGPQFSTGLDPTAQNLVSQGQQGLLNQARTQGQQARQQFGGGLGNVLAQQAQAQARIQQNPLMFQAAQQQRGREAEQFKLQQMAQQLTNQARLSQGQEQSRLQQLQNAGQLQQAALPFEAQKSLLGLLGQLGQLQGTQTQFEEKTPGGGIFGQSGIGGALGGIFGGIPGALIGSRV